MLRAMSLMLRAAVASDIGPVRSNNEDCAYGGTRLAVVADGMGGMPAGELASDIVTRALVPLDAGPDGPGDASDAAARLLEALAAANREIRAVTEADVAADGMGTTVTALLLAGSEVALLHVGDSRCYLWRDGSLSQLTKDDTFVQSLVDEGVLTAAEARLHPRRSIVTQAVQGLDLEPRVRSIEVRAGDRLIICSDGLSDFVTAERISGVVSEVRDERACAEQLVTLALRSGTSDNVTVVVADVVAEG
jgi:protein phosphatase